MADIPNTIQEAYQINETTKQFNLTDKFEWFAKNKWLSDNAIASAKVEIQNQFAKWNTETGMTHARFNTLRNNIQAKIENEIARARTELMKNSVAFNGVVIQNNQAGSQKIPADTPWIKNIPTVPQPQVGNIIQTTNWGYQNSLAMRHREAMNQ